MAVKKISELTAKTTELQELDLLNVSEWNGATYDTKSIDGSKFILSTKVSLSAAQIKTANSVPIALISAPGAGKAIEVISALVNFQYGTVAFDSGSTAFELQINTATTHQFLSSGFLNGTSNVFTRMGEVSSSTTQIMANEPLNFALSGADATVGDSTIDLYINYRIITL